MKYSNVTNIKWASNNNDSIVADVEFEGVGVIPFTATSGDPEPHGVEIYNRCVAGDFGDIASYTDLPAEITQAVTMRQARLALLSEGHLESVETAIAALSEPQKSAALIEWEYASTVERKSEFVSLLSEALSLTEVDVDDLFILADTL